MDGLSRMSHLRSAPRIPRFRSLLCSAAGYGRIPASEGNMRTFSCTQKPRMQQRKLTLTSMYRLHITALLCFLLAITQSGSSLALARQIQVPLDDAHGRIHSANDTGSAVPGSSPVRYRHDPSHNLFTLSQLDMHPNPCVMFVPTTHPTSHPTPHPTSR